MATGNPYMTSSTCEVLRLNRFTETPSNRDVLLSEVFKRTRVLEFLNNNFQTDPFDTPKQKDIFLKNNDFVKQIESVLDGSEPDTNKKSQVEHLINEWQNFHVPVHNAVKKWVQQKLVISENQLCIMMCNKILVEQIFDIIRDDSNLKIKRVSDKVETVLGYHLPVKETERMRRMRETNNQ